MSKYDFLSVEKNGEYIAERTNGYYVFAYGFYLSILEAIKERSDDYEED